MEIFKNYLTQSSTWKGLSLLAGLAGYTIAPGLFELVSMGVVGGIGIYETIRNQVD